jgi:hypothetical protein
MKALYIVFNGLQTTEALAFHIYVEASSPGNAIDIARPIFTWMAEHFGHGELFAKDLYAFPADAGALFSFAAAIPYHESGELLVGQSPGSPGSPHERS